MLSGDGNENGQKKSQQVLLGKNNFTAAAQFLVYLFAVASVARLRRETSRNSLVTRFRGEMSYVFLFNFFLTSAHFHLAGRQHFFIFSPPRKYCHVFIANEIGLLFLSLVLSLSLLSSSMQTMTTKVERKTRLCCCLIVPSKSPGGHAIYHLNAWVLEMQNFSTAYEGTEDFFRTKIYWMYNRTSANGHLSTTTTALRRPLFSLLRTKNHTRLLFKTSPQRQLSTVPTDRCEEVQL